MNIHKITVMVVDFDGLGAEELVDVLENTNFANDCIMPNVMNIETVDIGEWLDDNPLNMSDQKDAEFERLFNKQPDIDFGHNLPLKES